MSRKVIFFMLLGLAFTTQAFGQFLIPPRNQPSLLVPGQPALPFTAKDMEGNEISLSDYRGKVVLINFWATWCVGCRQEIPHLRDVYAKYKEKGFVIIGISQDRGREGLEHVIQQAKLEWPQIPDAIGANFELSLLYGVQALPTTFLLDRNGTVRYTNLRGSELETATKKLLDEVPGEEPPPIIPPKKDPIPQLKVSIGDNGFVPVNVKAAPQILSSVGANSLFRTKPDTITKEPKYEGANQLYGFLMLGTMENNIFTFALDLLPNQPPTLYFDKNQNGDLTDDEGLLASTNPRYFSTSIKIPFQQLIKETSFPGECELLFFIDSQLWEKGYAGHRSLMLLQGTVKIHENEYTAYIVDFGINDIDYTNDGICIDLNRDKEIDNDTERFWPKKPASSATTACREGMSTWSWALTTA